EVAMRGDPRESRTTHTEQFKAIREARFYESMAASQFMGYRTPMETGSVATTGNLMAVTPDFFALAGVTPRLGRSFAAGRTSGDDGSVVLAYDMWRRLFPGRD